MIIRMPSVMNLHTRKVTRTGGSYRIALPPDWLRTEGISEKNTLDLLESGMMIILPTREMKDEEIEESFECMRRMIKIAYRNRNARK